MAITSTVSWVEALLLAGVGSTTCASVMAMVLPKEKTWVLGCVQCSAQTSSTVTSMLTGRLTPWGWPASGVAVQPAGATAFAVTLTLTGP